MATSALDSEPTPSALLAHLEAAGVRVTADGAYLDVDAPTGVLTDADRAALRTYKPQLLALLKGNAAPASAPPVSVSAVEDRKLPQMRPYPQPARPMPVPRSPTDRPPAFACPVCQTRAWRFRDRWGPEWVCATCWPVPAH